MSNKPLRILPHAQADVAAAIDYYREEAGIEFAERLADAVELRLGAVAQDPQLGSQSYAAVLRIEGLRCIKLLKFPYLIFYIETAVAIEVVRMLHNRRNIPGTLADIRPR